MNDFERYEGRNRRVLASAFPCATPAALFGSRAAQGLEAAGNQTGGQPPRSPARHIHVCARTRTRRCPNPGTRVHLRSYTSTHPNPAAPCWHLPEEGGLILGQRPRTSGPAAALTRAGPGRARPRYFRAAAGAARPSLRDADGKAGAPLPDSSLRRGEQPRRLPDWKSSPPFPGAPRLPSASPLAASVTGAKTERPRFLHRSGR